MAKLSSMPMFWSDFFADTEHMNPDAAKAYLFLLGHAWLRKAKLPNDDDVLARLARCSRRSWASIRDQVLAFWEQDEEGQWTQKRLTKEWEYVTRRVNVNSENGSKGGRASAAKKYNKNNETEQATPSKSVKQPTPTPTPTPTKEEESKEDIYVASAPEHVQQAFDAYNELAKDCKIASPQLLTKDRAKKLSQRLKEAGGLDGWAYALTQIRGSPFLLGQSGNRDWRITFDWLLKPANFTKVMEGTYASSGKKRSFNEQLADARIQGHAEDDGLFGGDLRGEGPDAFDP